IKIRFLGHLATYFGEEAEVQKSEMSVADLLKELGIKIESQHITRANTLILINGIEISALNGDKTNVKDGDTVTLIPVSHGG
ncbi:MAG: MoaD/ThiS family protein, partial [Nitrososphaerales archaeon]